MMIVGWVVCLFVLNCDSVVDKCLCVFIISRENRMDQFGRFIRSMDDSVKGMIDRGQIHCEKCQGCKYINNKVNCHQKMVFSSWLTRRNSQTKVLFASFSLQK